MIKFWRFGWSANHAIIIFNRHGKWIKIFSKLMFLVKRNKRKLTDDQLQNIEKLRQLVSGEQQ